MATTREHQSRSKNLVGFVVGNVRYAVDILKVREIINPLPIVVLPHAPAAVVGVADHRGEVVPIIDLRIRFGLGAAGSSEKTKWVIVTIEDRAVGLVVDAVTDVFGAGPGEHRGAPELGLGDSSRGIAAVYKHEGSLVFVVDIERVAAPAEAIDVKSIVDIVAASSGGT
jgi:purine-binding chemotaxis protein CheW